MEKAGIAVMITGAWLGLRGQGGRRVREVGGRARRDRASRHAVRMQYYGQLNDIEIVSPHAELEEAAQLDDLIAEFEDAYGKVYARSARSPELGYLVTQAIVHGSVEVEKPALPDARRAAGDAAGQGDADGALGRRLRRDRSSTSSTRSQAGNAITGPAIVESVATTFAIPPGRRRAWTATRSSTSRARLSGT